MTKSEFIEILQVTLDGEMPPAKISENLNYYNDYISRTVSNGREEAGVLAELGDPRLIARTIIETYKLSKGPLHEERENQGQNPNYEEYAGQGYSYTGKDRTIPWYKKSLGILTVIGIIIVVIIIGGFAVNLFFKIIVPILFLTIVVSMIANLFKRKNK